MNRYIIGSLWDRSNRNGANKNFEYLFEGSKRIDELNYRADKILREAERINKLNNNTNERLDKIIADSGTSSTEVVDARGPYNVLSARLNEYDYLVNRPKLNNGKLILPSDFPEVPFNIYRKDKYNYVHDATPYNQFDWSDATEIFMTDKHDSSMSGLTVNEAASPATFKNNYDRGDYGAQDTFIFTLVDNIFTGSQQIFQQNAGINILVRSKSPQGKTIASYVKRNGSNTSEWTKHNDIYKTTITDGTSHTITDVINVAKDDGFGLSPLYSEKTSIAQVESTRGTFYQSGTTTYCNPHLTDNINDLVISTMINYVPSRAEHKTIMFENIIFMNDSTRPNYTNGVDLYYFNCGFYRGYSGDAFTIDGNYNVYLLDCVSAWGNKDGFNYHSDSPNSLAVEVNCKSYGNGMYKRSVGNSTTHSNNGSTAHEGMNMLRVGSHYWNNEGPPVADVNDCYSISIGVKVGDILGTTTGWRDAFHLSSELGESIKPKYVIECESYGKNITNGIHAPQGNAYYMDFIGSNSIVGAIPLESWE